MTRSSTSRRVFMMQATVACTALATSAAHAQTKVEEGDENAVALGYKHDTTKGGWQEVPQPPGRPEVQQTASSGRAAPPMPGPAAPCSAASTLLPTAGAWPTRKIG